MQLDCISLLLCFSRAFICKLRICFFFLFMDAASLEMKFRYKRDSLGQSTAGTSRSASFSSKSVEDESDFH